MGYGSSKAEKCKANFKSIPNSASPTRRNSTHSRGWVLINPVNVVRGKPGTSQRKREDVRTRLSQVFFLKRYQKAASRYSNGLLEEKETI